MTDTEFKALITTEVTAVQSTIMTIIFSKSKCHMQAVDLDIHVKLVTKPQKAVCGQEF